ncbi:TMEM165/GDT1 family protein [Lonepinella koalarum]|uniref:TMEM165/GDT1 family protein n=1 Tax=Lonepinella koalarum TaxID=53417 RepID=UPI0011E4B6D5|nr:TMEM165/GDT1 family protein [Lonepinella koalarum]TYG35566.1 TMEM165/GDT1 family protein [Lonepinella koalarum]
MSNENLPQEIGNKDEFIKEFFAIQQQEIAVKRDELLIRKEESKLNQEVALASISSQEKVELKRGDVYLSTQKGKYWLWGGLALLTCTIIAVAMYLNQSDIAIRIIEIGGAVLLGYFAGINRGKAQILEQQNRQSNNE